MECKDNCSWVKGSNMCHGCGACSAVCPVSAIEMKNDGEHNFPEIGDECIHCGLCNEVCSGVRVEVNNAKDPFRQLKQCRDNVYLAYSNDDKIREAGSSGGFITQCLIDLFDNKIIDAAIVVYSGGVFADCKAIVASSRDEVISSVGSKYCPVSVCSVLSKIDRVKRYAFVGKGCDIASLELYCKVKKIPPDLFYAKIGIMCSHTPYARETDKLMHKCGFDDVASTGIVYRGEGWPGRTIVFNDEKRVELDYKQSWCENLAIAGPSKRCSLCIERFASKADIVVGDAWVFNRQLENQDGGISLLLVYSSRGRDLIDFYSRNQTMTIEQSTMKICVASQPHLLNQFGRAYMVYLLRAQYQALKRLNIKKLFASMFTFINFVCHFKVGPKKIAGAVKLFFKF